MGGLNHDMKLNLTIELMHDCTHCSLSLSLFENLVYLSFDGTEVRSEICKETAWCRTNLTIITDSFDLRIHGICVVSFIRNDA